MLDTSKIYTSNSHGKFRITKYVNCSNVEVEFIKTKTKKKTQSIHILNGAIRDSRFPSVLGVGFVGCGSYQSRVDGELTRQYSTWSKMMQRCYSENSLKNKPTYKGCSVCGEWHNFQIFAKWFDENYIDGHELDKDIKIDGNKIYSPSACVFTSHKNNSIKAKAKHYTVKSPDGNKVDVYNMSEFCRVNSLNRGNMGGVTSGKRSQHKGWTNANN
tara:strand:- start:3 stop:647 length:645 start_codon:yes stop_codon:yes gene_type:complete